MASPKLAKDLDELTLKLSLIKPNKYFTDGERLYWIVEVGKTFAVVENCSTLFTHKKDISKILRDWHPVEALN